MQPLVTVPAIGTLPRLWWVYAAAIVGGALALRYYYYARVAQAVGFNVDVIGASIRGVFRDLRVGWQWIVAFIVGISMLVAGAADVLGFTLLALPTLDPFVWVNVGAIGLGALQLTGVTTFRVAMFFGAIIMIFMATWFLREL